MYRKLRDVGHIETGYQLRTAILPVEDGFFDVIRLGDVSQKEIAVDNLVRLDLDIREGEYRIHAGDVLFRSRGGNYKAAVVGALNRPTVALAPLYIYRNANSAVNSEFICWWLNLAETQVKIEELAVGTNIKSVPLAQFAELQIPLVDLELQQKIVNIDRLNRQERILELALAEKRAELVEQTLVDAVKSAAGKLKP